jgi:hypothetical protein
MPLLHVRPSLVAAIAVAPLLLASAAWACTAVAEVRTESSSVEQGADVRGSGEGFSGSAVGDAEIRLDSEDGALLWQGRPDDAGGINFVFTMPDVEPRTYVLMAIQREANGDPVYGTPARTTIEVTSRPASSDPAPATSDPQPEPAPAAAPARTPAASAARPTAPAPQPASTSTASAIAPAPSPVEVAAPALAFEEPIADVPAFTPEPLASQPPVRSAAEHAPPIREGGSLTLAFALVGPGFLLTSLAAAVALRSGRRDSPIPARRPDL